MEEVERLQNEKEGKLAFKLVKELALRVEALEQRGSLDAAPTSASEIPDLKPETSEPAKKKKKSAETVTEAPSETPVETPSEEPASN